MRWGRRRSGRRTPALTAAQRATAWQCASLLLDYPTSQQPLEAIGAAVGPLPELVGEPLRRFVDHRLTTDLVDLQADYVATFDTRRRCNLYLTYFVHGDTRKRGMALLRFKQAYQAAGLELTDAELPDHLCVVLEFAATVDGAVGQQLMTDHRAGLEMLRMALRDADSPWADVMEAVSATLPALRGEEVEAVQRLAAEGPPDEEVGLTPYGTPAFDALLSSATREQPVDLPMPTVPPRAAPAAVPDTKGA